ncbi:MAG TPA: DUF5693 family protein [Candidatus Cybelea sp.]
MLRARVESHANRVELAMDFTDFDALARSYDYSPAAFLIALRRAGLTSLAITEELGSNVGYDGKAYATTGAALLNQARISPISDPLLATLVRTHRIDRGRSTSSSRTRRPITAIARSWRCTSCPRACASYARRVRG